MRVQQAKRQIDSKLYAKQGEVRGNEGERAREMLVEGVRRIIEEGRWRDFLSFAGKFHSYSARNMFLIYSQAIEREFVPSKVAGFVTWKKLGRNVRKGEKGLAIFVPITCGSRTVAAPESHLEKKQPLVPETKESILGFRRSYVFDVSQTEGDDLEEPLLPEILQGEAMPLIWDFLISHLADMDYRVVFADLDGINGKTDVSVRKIEISYSVPPLQQLKTLCHELGHAIMHDSGSLDRGRCEIEAESFAFLFLSLLGVDSAQYSFPYITRWSDGDLDEILDAVAVPLFQAQKVHGLYRARVQGNLLTMGEIDLTMRACGLD